MIINLLISRLTTQMPRKQYRHQKKSTKNTAKQYKQTPSTTPANNTGNTTAPANNTNNTGSNKGFAQEVLELVNAERARPDFLL